VLGWKVPRDRRFEAAKKPGRVDPRIESPQIFYFARNARPVLKTIFMVRKTRDIYLLKSGHSADAH
jgi:hypothetical protein